MTAKPHIVQGLLRYWMYFPSRWRSISLIGIFWSGTKLLFSEGPSSAPYDIGPEAGYLLLK